jgi:hypothetical protein
MNKRFLWSLAALTVLVISTDLGAAELRGRLWGSSGQGVQPGTMVQVTCQGENPRDPESVAHNGSYSVRGLPPERGCQLTVIVGGARSQPVAFNTSRSVVSFNAEVRNYQGRILVLPR